MGMSHPGVFPSKTEGKNLSCPSVSVSLVSDANDEIKMSSKLNAESIGDWACTMANGIKGEMARGGRKKRGRDHPPLLFPLRAPCGCRLFPLPVIGLIQSN